LKHPSFSFHALAFDSAKRNWGNFLQVSQRE